MTENELLHKLAAKSSRGDQDYQADEVFRLLEVTRRMKNSLESIANVNIESAFQKELIKAIAREGLQPNAKQTITYRATRVHDTAAGRHHKRT